MKPNFPIEVITGSAGTGKTTLLKSRIAESKSNGNHTKNYATLCATTGIAAVNLGDGTGDSVTTINSELGYFDTESLRDKYQTGRLQDSLLKVCNKGQHLAIDEMSMMEADQLDLLYQALTEVNDLAKVQARGGLGLILSGDFCQLPPVKGKFAFQASCWGYIAPYINKLTKVWRQENLEFLEALNAARRGDGNKAAEILDCLSKKNNLAIFSNMLDDNSDSTIVCAINKDVDRINNARLLRLLSEGKKKVEFKSFRWGKQKPEWKLIPTELTLAEGCYVMILSNNPPDFDYANGDCGTFLEARNVKTKDAYGEEVDLSIKNQKSVIKLKRNEHEVIVSTVIRRIYQKDTPDGMAEPPEYHKTRKRWEEARESSIVARGYEPGDETESSSSLNYKRYLRELTFRYKIPNQPKPYFDFEEGKWVVGEIQFMPLRLGYASTCHKTQGLTLDAIQLDIGHHFFGSPSMSYVALSRVRSERGLRIIGNPRLLAERTNVLGEVLEWI